MPPPPAASGAEAWTVGRLIRVTRDHLAAKGIEEPRADAEILLAHVLGLERLQLYVQHDRPVDDEERARFRTLIQRRSRREPVSHLLGEREFYGRPFAVDARVLTPRPETEHLVDAALDWLKLRASARPAAPLRLLDLGTGSGCIAITLAAEWRAWSGAPEGARLQVVAVDRSREALELAERNARALLGAEHGIRLLASDWFSALESGTPDRFDLIVSNPPYIPPGEEAGLEPEVRDHEPRAALFSETPIEAHIAILEGGRDHLESEGAYLLEVGASGASELDEHLADKGWSPATWTKDYAGIRRVALVAPNAPVAKLR